MIEPPKRKVHFVGTSSNCNDLNPPLVDIALVRLNGTVTYMGHDLMYL